MFMTISAINIIPVTEARSMLGDLSDQVKGEQYVILTKKGKAKAALVDVMYLQSLEQKLRQLLGKTFIQSSVVPYTRDFSDEEIREWQKEDSLS